jgi:SET domain-containing protein
MYQNGYVAPAGRKGRGVFANRKLKSGQVVEVSPYIEIPEKQYNKLSGTIIESYRFEVQGNKCAIGLGNVSIYNHSKKPNAEVFIDARKRTLTIETLRPIKKDEEITIDYGYELDL